MPVRGGSEFSVEIAPADLAQLLKEVRGFSPELYKQMRKRIRTVADEGVQDVRRRLMGRTFHIDAGLARGLAAGTKVSIRTGVRTAGVSITTTGAKLPPGKQAMVRAYNKQSFRHPVGGNRQNWVTQKGRPYFGAVLDARKADMAKAVEQALRDAIQTVRTGETS